MLYIFDMGNVIIDIDFKRVLSVWSNLSGKPLSELSSDFIHGETFKQHECGKISDVEFAEAINDQLDMSLSFDEFAEGWQAIFISVRPDVIDIMNRLREQGHSVVVLSNTNRLHQDYWPQHYPEIAASADFLYLSQDLGLRKPDPDIYQYVLETEEFEPQDAVFFDDVRENVDTAVALGIKGVLVTDRDTVSRYFAEYDFSAEVTE